MQGVAPGVPKKMRSQLNSRAVKDYTCAVQIHMIFQSLDESSLTESGHISLDFREPAWKQALRPTESVSTNNHLVH